MKSVVMVIAAFIVALVAFGGWYGGMDSSKVEAGFAPLEITEMVIDGTTENIVFRAVETTSIAENRHFPFDEFKKSCQLVYATGPPVNRSHEAFKNVNLGNLLWGGHQNYLADYRACASRSTINWTMRYRA